MPPIPPIAPAEFLQLLQRCIPPGGWPCTLAVATSAGPDSTCLLHLLAALVNSASPTPGLPARLLSLHVNHKLQACADDMARHAARTAAALGIPHTSHELAWRTPPAKGAPLEQRAQAARTAALARAMDAADVRVVAYGHHADDLVETAVMRLARGSSLQHAPGMKPVRRWGMGGASASQPISLRGMRRWIVRPFLSVPKDRLLATCDANGWEYATDPTNFQPDLTIRNAIRHTLAHEENPDAAPRFPVVAASIQRVREQLQAPPGRAGLREAVQRLARDAERVDTQVSNALAWCTAPNSPPSTVILSTPRLEEITDPDVRVALVRRVLRCVSPRVWGSPQAEAGGRRESLEAIVGKLWAPWFECERAAFNHGSNVVWRPIAIGAGGSIKERRQAMANEDPGWIVHRAAPRGEARLNKTKRVNPVARDITEALAQAETGVVSILYDCRFVVDVDVEHVPDGIMARMRDGKRTARIKLRDANKWYIPQMVVEEDGEEEILAEFDWQPWRKSKRCPRPVQLDTSSWVEMRFIRPLEAL